MIDSTDNLVKPINGSESDDFEQPCGTHSATDTHRADNEFCIATLAFDERVTNQART